MANKRKLKAEIITLRNRVDELAARIAALESRQWAWPVAPTRLDGYPVITCTDHPGNWTPDLIWASGGER